MVESKETAGQKRLFAEQDEPSTSVIINGRCQIRKQGTIRVVVVGGIPLAHYVVGDRMSEAHAIVSLIEQGWAQQNELARAFECSERTIRRHQRRFEEGGLAALGRPSGYPRTRRRLANKRTGLVERWKAHGESNREIARRLGVSEKSVRKLLGRLGWKQKPAEQLSLDADPNLSGSAASQAADLSSPAVKAVETTAEQASSGADPNLSASGSTRIESDNGNKEPPAICFDTDPADRQTDRVLAALGLLDDAAPLFGKNSDVQGAGVLLAIPALVASGVIDIAHEEYGSIGPAFYGLRTTIVTLLLMALMRIKRPESLKERSPEDLGRLLGLDRAPEVKTLRRKLARLATFGRSTEFGRALAARRVESRGHALGFLYVDGHVRAYHGKRDIPKAFVSRRHLAMPATTDYWVNDAQGEPLFVVTCEANRQLTTMLPGVLDEVRSLVGERRVTVVFDRGGWSPKLFQKLIAQGFDILTYRKGRFRRLAKQKFSTHKATIDGREVSYMLADHGVRLLKGKLRLRQVLRLCDDGKHQTPIITSRRDLSAVEVAYRMFERWRQENFFKYLREEYALDALVDYGIETADPRRMIPNPDRRALAAKVRQAKTELNELVGEYGLEALRNLESARRTMRGFKIANAALSTRVVELMKRIVTLEKKRARMPTQVPVKHVLDGNVVKLAVERKHLTDLLKMVAYQAESDLVRLISPHYHRAEDEARTFVQNALATAGDLVVTDNELRIALQPLSSPHRTKALAALCEQLNATRTRFPGSALRLRFDLKPEPAPSLAFPGARSSRIADPAP
jgi:DNA-binding CsgD family transcriptional regulator